ncbi:hypothetical protein AM228_08465 [Planktothricoides sp. SR001]|nr:hypothetical protein AM228_08465 [Planktothricoides sp. SR001]
MFATSRRLNLGGTKKIINDRFRGDIHGAMLKRSAWRESPELGAAFTAYLEGHLGVFTLVKRITW